MPAPNITGQEIIDGLYAGEWAGGSSLVLTYSVATAGSDWSYYSAGEEPDRAGYDVFNATQAAAFATAMELWDSYVAASFVETDDVSDPGAIRIAITTPEAGEWGYAYLPSIGGNPNVQGLSGDIWVSSASDGATSDYPIGGYDFNALLHEIGHALGLTHTFEGSPPIPLEFDNYRYSIMSYTEQDDLYIADFQPTAGGGITRNFVRVNPITPMIFDIYVIQSMYGADPDTNSGDTTYTFDPDAAGLQTIYDAGGIDTWDLTGHTRASVIDLREASFSSIDFYSATAQIEDAVDIFGEGFRGFITEQVNFVEDNTYFWEDNVAIAYGTVIENVFLGVKNDSVIGNEAANDFRGFNGADFLDGRGGDDNLRGGLGADTLIGGSGRDTALYTNSRSGVTVNLATGLGAGGEAEGDTLSNIESVTGSNFDDVLTGSAISNTLIGNSGNDTLSGGDGHDTLRGGVGADTLDGGAGTDTVTYAASTVGVTVNLNTGAASGGDAAGDTIAGFERITGSSFNDSLTGSGGANILTGGVGDDVLNGLAGNDRLIGSAGADVFVFTTALANNSDRIVDFNPTDDVIRIDDAIFTGLAAGTLAAAAFRIGSAAADADDRIIYNAATGQLFFDADGSGASAQVRFATLEAGLALTRFDFVVI